MIQRKSRIIWLLYLSAENYDALTKISPTFKAKSYYAYIISCNIITITIKRSNTTSTHDKLLQRNDALSIFKSRYFWGCKGDLMKKRIISIVSIKIYTLIWISKKEKITGIDLLNTSNYIFHSISIIKIKRNLQDSNLDNI